MVLLEPTPAASAVAWIELERWVNRHFVAISDVATTPRSAGEQHLLVEAGETEEISAELAEWSSFDWPIRTVEECKRLIECRDIRPSVLVDMDFTGALRSALEARGKRALSVDLRPCEGAECTIRETFGT